MKILLVSNSNPHFSNTNTNRLKAIKDCGHEPIFFNDREFLIPGRIRKRFTLFHRWDLNRLNRKLVEFVGFEQPAICLMVGGFRTTATALTKIRNAGVRTALWTTDPPQNYSNIIETSKLYDHVFCAGTEAIELLANHGIHNTHWLPFGCDPEIHRPVKLEKREIDTYAKDVTFVGGFYENRWNVLKQLNHKAVGIWGPNWEQVKKGPRSISYIESRPVDVIEWVKIYSAAKIVIVIHFKNDLIPCYQASPKVFEALSCGRFVLVDRQKDVFRLFKDKEHLVGFDNIEDLKQKISYYLSNPLEMNRIASNGRKEVLKKHTYRQRIQEILTEFHLENEK